jgi:two-component system, NarL family, sensor histidine kinase DevS
MKDRQKFQIFDGFRNCSGRPANQSASRMQGTPADSAESISHPLHGQIENSLTAALTASERRLSALLHDRRRIGRELHDTVLQALHAIGLSLAQSHELGRGVPQPELPARVHAADQLHTVIQDIRRMILSVESDSVDPIGLISELQILAETFKRVSELRIRVEVDPVAEEILTGEEARELLTISREAMSNCVRHARATRVVIALRHIGSRVRLSIRDNGSGFDVKHGPAKGIGFAHMEDRIRKIGGRLNIQSMEGRGTCVTADVYLEPILTTV